MEAVTGETALIIREKLDLIKDTRVLRSRIEEQDALIAELSQKLAEREAHCKTLRRQRNKYVELLKEQSSREFLTKLAYTCAAVFLMVLTIYSLNTVSLFIMRWFAFN